MPDNRTFFSVGLEKQDNIIYYFEDSEIKVHCKCQLFSHRFPLLNSLTLLIKYLLLFDISEDLASAFVIYRIFF